MATLLEKAKIREKDVKRKKYRIKNASEEEIELVFACLRGEITDMSAVEAISAMTNNRSSFGHKAWPILKYAYREGYITINPKK